MFHLAADNLLSQPVYVHRKFELLLYILVQADSTPLNFGELSMDLIGVHLMPLEPHP